MRSKTYIVFRIVTGAAAYLVASTGFADIIAVPPPPNHPAADRTKCSAKWTWNMVAAAEAGANPCDPFWVIRPKSPAVAAPPDPPRQKDLTFDFQHLLGPHRRVDIDPAPNPAPLIVNAGPFAPRIKRAGVVKIDHPTTGATDHHDVYSWTAEITAERDGEITANAKHIEAVRPPGWSYDPGNEATFIEVFTSYAVGDNKPAKDVPQEKITEKKEGGLAPGGAQGAATDWQVRATIGDPFTTDLTLAFISGEPGNFAKADIGLMNEFFTGGREYFIPMLFDVGQTLDLFAAVDLTQWLSFPTPFAFGDRFDLTDGTSSLLPGFLFSTSPIHFDPVVGFTGTPGDFYTGSVEVMGRANGHNVPEPCTLLLITAALAGLVGCRGRGRRSAGPLSADPVAPDACGIGIGVAFLEYDFRDSESRLLRAGTCTRKREGGKKT